MCRIENFRNVHPFRPWSTKRTMKFMIYSCSMFNEPMMIKCHFEENLNRVMPTVNLLYSRF